MNSLLRALPHVLTSLNLAAGVVACIQIIEGHEHAVLWCFGVSLLADFLDGFAARAAGVSGEFGKELDSLADVVSFGVSPALMAYTLIASTQPELEWLPYLALFIAVMSAVRLAKFNTEMADTKHFIGLPVPAHATFWVGLYAAWNLDGNVPEGLQNPWVLLVAVVMLSLTLVSELTLFSNKINPKRKANWPVAFPLLGALILPASLGHIGISLVVLLYLVSGLLWRPEVE